jgi:dienelactone hydrolase
MLRKDLRAYGGRLAPAGMAVLMYDKRGTGDSTGVFQGFSPATCEALHDELAADALAAVEYLRRRPDIDADRIGLIGGRQAGWVMPLAASRSAAVRFIIALAGPAVTCGQVDAYQRLTGVQGDSASGLTLAQNEAAVAAAEIPPGFDPAPLLADLEIPTLWILAEQDGNVPTALSAAVLEDLRGQGHRNLLVEIRPGADHDLRDLRTGELVDPWPLMSAWLRREKMLHPPRASAR